MTALDPAVVEALGGRKAAARDYLNRGYHYKDVAVIVGASYPSVNNWARANGWPQNYDLTNSQQRRFIQRLGFYRRVYKHPRHTYVDLLSKSFCQAKCRVEKMIDELDGKSA